MSCLPLLRLCRLTLITTLLGTLGSAALAIQPVAQNELYEIRLPEFMPDRQVDKAFAAEDFQVSKALGDRLGGDWVVHTRSLRTRSPHYVYGKSQPLGAALQSPQQVEALARQVMADNPEVFSAQSTQLRLDKTPRTRGKWAAHFQQTHQGVEVGQGKCLYAHDQRKNAGKEDRLPHQLSPERWPSERTRRIRRDAKPDGTGCRRDAHRRQHQHHRRLLWHDPRTHRRNR